MLNKLLSMFGLQDIPFEISHDGLLFSVKGDEKRFFYKRKTPGEDVDKILLLEESKLLINPVEPVNKPRKITPNLLIKFEKSIVMDSRSTKKIYVKFPVEIGIFIHGSKYSENIDIFTLAKQKYTLYGDIRKGIICKYYRSGVYFSIPSSDPLQEGVMELIIRNTTSRVMEITMAVFNPYGMRIYYSDDMVSMRAEMEILSETVAETDFVNSPLKKGMKKSIKLYTTRKLPGVSSKFTMEAGL